MPEVSNSNLVQVLFIECARADDAGGYVLSPDLPLLDTNWTDIRAEVVIVGPNAERSSVMAVFEARAPWVFDCTGWIDRSPRIVARVLCGGESGLKRGGQVWVSPDLARRLAGANTRGPDLASVVGRLLRATARRLTG